MKTFLHVGCGPQTKIGLKGFDNDQWKEVRFDIDKTVNPDIVGTLVDMSKVASNSVEAVYSSHNIEHVYPHQVPIVVREFLRVLKDDGIVVLHCPDLQSVCEAVADNKLLETLYETEDGHKISAIDILYGWRVAIANGNEYMAHKGGFTYSVLNDSFLQAGFKMNYGGRVPGMNLFIVSSKQLLSEKEIVKIGKPFFPKS